jgi:hypothetical protein
MIKKIVFFSFSPIVKKMHYKRFGVEILKENGFEVWIYDFSPIAFPSLHNGVIHRIEKIISDDYSLFYDEKKAIQAIHELDEDCFVVVAGYYQLENFKIYRALSKANIPYAAFITSSSPLGIGSSGEPLLWKLFFKFKRFKLKKLKQLLYSPKLAPLLGIRAPDMCILGGEKSLAHNGAPALIGNKTELLWTHAHDYDTYLDDLHNKEAEENIAVFIEPPGPMHPWDQLAQDQDDVLWTIEEYYPSHCRFFDYVEQELNLQVVIAAHPKTNHTDYPEYFGKRHVIRNQLIPLIKKSKLTMTHNSTALVLVAVERKPILILTNAAFEKDKFASRRFKLTAASFGKTPINVDQLPYSIDWQKELLVNEDLYLSYQQQYVKKTDSENLNSWQILANRLKKSNFLVPAI